MTMLYANGHMVHLEVLEPPASGRIAGTAVLIHGMGWDSLASWHLTVAKPLCDTGLRVITYDLRGHGLSERPATGYRLDDFVDDLRAVLAGVGVRKPLFLIGNSFGGTIAFAYAARVPVAGVAVIESAPPTREWIGRVIRRLEWAAAYLPDNDVMARIAAARGERASRNAQAVRQLLSSTSLVPDISSSPLPSPAEISGLACPVLCVYGGDSAVSDFAAVVRRLLPHARTVVLPGQRHSLLIDEPETVRELLLSWLDSDCAQAVTPITTPVGGI